VKDKKMEIKQPNNGPQEKILLLLLPFWDPQIPPLGLACLKSYLGRHGYEARTVDANLEVQFRELYDRYFELLKEYIPVEKQGNLFNIGNQVLRNHMMAHLNHEDKRRYIELVEILVYETFFCRLDPIAISRLNEVLAEFYARFERYFLTLLEEEKPTVLGLSVYGDTFPASLAAFKLAKEKNPLIKTVMGGGIFADQLAPGSPELDYFLERTKDTIDKVIIGEGEELMLRFLRGELAPSRKVYGMKDIGGRVTEMSSLGVPDFSDFDLQYYPHLAHYGARSCPYQCKFCSETVNWGRYRKKAVSQTVKEFIELQQRYAYQLFLMTDSTLNPIITDLAKAFTGSSESIYWDGFLRADRHVCDTANTLLWRQGGFYRAKLGLESGSQRVLDLMDKRISLEQSEAALTSLAYAGIKTTTFWLFGYPGETEEDFQQTLDFVEKCKDNIYEADCNAFNYYLTGQANSEEWLKNNKGIPLYPEWAREMLITRTWVLDSEPSREVSYQRLNRFIEHCKKLGIPNPYSLSDVYKADQRWQKLHKNAVPSLVELKNKDTYIDENQYVEKLSFAQVTLEDDDDWL
jgi:radical SAM superfamily enzyme YgiQ (UPF0313 family)